MAASGGAAVRKVLDSKLLLLFFVDEQAASLRSSLPQFRAADIDIVVGADGAKAAAHKASRWLVAAPMAREPMIDSRRGRRRRRPTSVMLLLLKSGDVPKNGEKQHTPKRENNCRKLKKCAGRNGFHDVSSSRHRAISVSLSVQ